MCCQVLRDYIRAGDYVGKSADAWLRVADELGVASREARAMATIHKASLDAYVTRAAQHTRPAQRPHL